MQYSLPAFLRRPLVGLCIIAAIFIALRLTTPDPDPLTFDDPVVAIDPGPVESVPLVDRLVPVHRLAICLDELALRITVESSAAFEVFDHAYRDECRSPVVATDPQWRIASEWFGRAFLPAIYGILDSERALVARAVQQDRATGRPLRAAALWRSALASQASRLREFADRLVLAYSSVPDLGLAPLIPDASVSPDPDVPPAGPDR